MGAAAEEEKARCELCGDTAAVHCAADSAFLCLPCDARVHGANFLASRHHRRCLAPSSAVSSASNSSCVSTADSAESTAAGAAAGGGGGRGRERRTRAEAVLEVWAKRMGFAPGPARRRAAAALRALGRGVGAVPLRVAMAAALWSEVSSSPARCKGRRDVVLLCRLEAAAHVPTRLVLTVASWMARSRTSAVEEGWDECS